MASRFEEEWDAAERSVFIYCYRVLQDHADAEDACQEVRIRAYRSYSQFRGESAFATWVMRIARNVVYNALNRRRDRSAISRPLPEVEPAAPDPNLQDIDDDDANAALWDAIQEAVARKFLNEIEAKIIRIKFEDDSLTGIEIDDFLGIRNSNVIQARARQQFCVFLFVFHFELLGGLASLKAAFEKAQANPDAPLTAEEQRQFRQYVLRQHPPHPSLYRMRELRSACLKVKEFHPFFRRKTPGESRGR